MKRGFSLIEILCVISLIGIIIYISYPVIDIFTNLDKLNSASDMLVNDLRFAKMHAISKNRSSVSVFFIEDDKNVNYKGYFIYDPANYSHETLKEVYFSKGIIVSKKDSTFINNKISFKPNGNISPFACTVTLLNIETGEKSTITLTIGFTRIMKIYR